MAMPPHLQEALERKRAAKAAGTLPPPKLVPKPAPKSKQPSPVKLVPPPPPRIKVDKLGLVAAICGMSKAMGMEIIQGSKAANIPGVIHTNAALDGAIGRGGIPYGRLTVYTGGEGGGKTTLALENCREVQHTGGIAIYIDAERKLDLQYAADLGVNVDELLMAYPDNAEDGFKFMDGAIDKIAAATAPLYEKKNGKNVLVREALPPVPVVLILDSVNALLSKIQTDGDYGDQTMGQQARAFSEALPRFLRKVSGHMVACIFISQQRSKMGGQHQGSNKEKVSGGNAVKYYAALVLDIIFIGKYRKNGADSGPWIGSEVKIIPIKNQIAKPFQEAMTRIHWGTGFDQDWCLLQRAEDMHLLNTASGGWYDLPWDGPEADAEGTLKWQGQNGFKKLCLKVPTLRDYIHNACYEKFTTLSPLPVAEVVEVTPEEAEEAGAEIEAAES